MMAPISGWSSHRELSSPVVRLLQRDSHVTRPQLRPSLRAHDELQAQAVAVEGGSSRDVAHEQDEGSHGWLELKAAHC